jgi:3-(3-hydroxy-phenyl)propionate hydroxylase
VVIERKAVYRFHGLVANRWRDGRALIAGDAAHQTPPFAGQGMCAGLRDAANLAWKLAAILKGGADASLLDSYQAEREPHVRAAIELAIGMGRVVCTLDPDAAAQRDAGMLAARAAGAPGLPPPQAMAFAAGCIAPGTPGAGSVFPQPCVDQDGGRLRLDDVVGNVAWLLSRQPVAEPASDVTALTLDDARLAAFHAPLLAWLDRLGVDAVLVRPDRYVFGAGEPGQLLAAWARSLAQSAKAED